MYPLQYVVLFGIFFVSVAGTLSHFCYKWSGCSALAGLFCPVSESTWEHIKLLFFPMLLYTAFIGVIFRKACPCAVSSLLAGILSGSALIPVIFYTYSGILGFHTLFLDIATFLISVFFAFRTAYLLTLSCKAAGLEPLLKLAVLAAAAAFWLFTYHPPKLGLFRDPGA